VPVVPDRGEDGLGRARTWDWPDSVSEVPLGELGTVDPDVVVLQRPRDLDLVVRFAGRWAGADVPAVYVEHSTPCGHVPDTRHPMAERTGVPVAHVTGFNDLMWDCGAAPTTVVEHGIVDPGARYSGEVPRAAVVVNDPVRRGRTVGTDLLPRLAAVVGTDVFGMRVDQLAPPRDDPGSLATFEDLPQDAMHAELARRRVYVHTPRWTSLGLSLLEAMHLGMPVVAVGSTEAFRAVPPEAGVVTSHVPELLDAVRRLVADPELCAAMGAAARAHALQHYGLERFLSDWDAVLDRVVSGW